MEEKGNMPEQKQITKDMILHSALKILKQSGMESVNIKTLAKDLKCSTQPVYLSFNGMDDLRNELIPMAVKEFEDVIRSQREDGEVCLYDMEYIHFAKKEPKLFCFLFMRPNAFYEMKRMLSPIIERSVKELMETYNISYEEADVLHDHLWMHTHGIAAMIATDFCDWDLEKAGRMVKESIEAFTGKYEV